MKAMAGKGIGEDDKGLEWVRSEVITGLECRAVMKRLSKDNYKEKGKLLAKITHPNPLVVFSVILGQIESYDNMITLIVDSFKHLSPLALDVLSHQLLTAVGGGNTNTGSRNKLKDDGLNASNWMSALETFIGVFYKKNPHVELRGILRFIVEKLRDNSVLELGIVKSLMNKMGGVEIAEGVISQQQLDGRAGGSLLKRETTNFGIVEKISKKSVKQLRLALSEPDVGLPLLVLTAQIRNRVVYMTETKHLKFIGNMYDVCTRMENVLAEFLSVDKERYEQMVPSLSRLVGTTKDGLGLDPEVVFTIARPLIGGSVRKDEENAQKKSSGEKNNPQRTQSLAPRNEGDSHNLQGDAPLGCLVFNFRVSLRNVLVAPFVRYIRA